MQRVCQALKVTNAKSNCESFFDYTVIRRLKKNKNSSTCKSQDKHKSFTFKSCIGSIS